MYSIKTNPNVETDGVIFQNCKIENNVLLLETDSDNFKYENNKWYVKSHLKDEWVYLGLGANPSYTVQYASPSPIFSNVFENYEEVLKEAVVE